MNNIIGNLLVKAAVNYIHPIKVSGTIILIDCCPKHGDECPTGRAHCKSCGARLHEGFCVNQLCVKSYEGKQTTRL